MINITIGWWFLYFVKEKLKKLNFLLISICVISEKTYVRSSYSQGDTAAAAIPLPSRNIRADVSNHGMNIISYSSSTLKLVYSH